MQSECGRQQPWMRRRRRRRRFLSSLLAATPLQPGASCQQGRVGLVGGFPPGALSAQHNWLLHCTAQSPPRACISIARATPICAQPVCMGCPAWHASSSFEVMCPRARLPAMPHIVPIQRHAPLHFRSASPAFTRRHGLPQLSLQPRQRHEQAVSRPCLRRAEGSGTL